MGLRWQVVLWLVLIGAGVACMLAFLVAGHQYLGWFGGQVPRASAGLATSEWLQLFLVMPAGLFWMAAIFPALRIHFHTGRHVATIITGLLVLADLLALIAGSMAL